MDKKQRAVHAHRAGYNCSQAVLGVFCETLGIDEKTAMKFASGFGGGIQCGEMCGAVTGGIMALGLKYGQSEAIDQETKRKMSAHTKELQKRFKDIHDTTSCRELLGCDMSTDEGKAYAKANNLSKLRCDLYIENVVELVEQML